LAVALGAFALHAPVDVARAQGSTLPPLVQDSPLLQPSLTDPNNPQRFGRPPDPVARSQPSNLTPTPPSGAGQTGFDSTGSVRKRKDPKRKPGDPFPPPPKQKPPPVIGGGPPARPTAQTTAPQSAARGTYANVYRPSDALPRPPRPPKPPDEPFDPLGVRVGDWLLKPAIEIQRGVDSNPARVPVGTRSPFTYVAPELVMRSQWARHELTANLRGSYIWYDQFSSQNRPTADMRINGRLDITRDTKINGEGRFILGTDNPGSPNLQAGLAKLPIYTTLGATLGLTQSFNRLEVSVKGLIDRTRYHDSQLTDGTTASNAARDYTQYGVQLRTSYEFTPGIKPFVGVDTDKRVHDVGCDCNNPVQRDSQAITPRVGATFDITRILTGEVSIGYLMRRYQDPTLADLRGVVADASLTWIATGLTTVVFTATSYADESILPGVSGALRRDLALRVDHAFRRWLIGSLRFGYGFDTYVGLGRDDKRASVSGGITYKLNREIWLKGEVRQDWLRSNVTGVDYNATSYLLGLRLQR
jgi:hypothetical protein